MQHVHAPACAPCKLACMHAHDVNAQASPSVSWSFGVRVQERIQPNGELGLGTSKPGPASIHVVVRYARGEIKGPFARLAGALRPSEQWSGPSCDRTGACMVDRAAQPCLAQHAPADAKAPCCIPYLTGKSQRALFLRVRSPFQAPKTGMWTTTRSGMLHARVRTIRRANGNRGISRCRQFDQKRSVQIKNSLRGASGRASRGRMGRAVARVAESPIGGWAHLA